MPLPRRRDRRGRGLRGRRFSATVHVAGRSVPVPAWRSRTDAFDALVAVAVADLEQDRPEVLAAVEFAVEDVPDPGLAEQEGVVADDAGGGSVPLGRVVRGTPPRLVVYRRPLEARAEDTADLADLLREVLEELVRELLGS